MSPIRCLDVGEDSFDRGLAHGRSFKDDVAANLKTYLRRFEASGLAPADALAEGARWQAAMARQNDDYVAEMKGIAAGAEQSEAAVALLNARYEVAFTLFGRDAQKSDAQARDTTIASPGIAETDGCTSFGALPEATADGHTWLGQNWDWLAGIHGHTLVLRIRRSRRPSLVCLTEAGIVGGKMGVNETGIGLVENGLACDHDGRNPYQKPFHMRCREVLDADRYDDALRPVVETRRTCSANFVIGAAGGEIIDLETSPDHVCVLHPADGLITHANHFLGTGHGESQMERIGPGTLFRAARLRRLLTQANGRLGLAAFHAATSDHFGLPNGICRHPDERQPEAKRTMTAGAVLIDLDARLMHVANGPPCTHDYVPFAVET
ncbi:MAG: hypothetical protein HXX10_05260 [Rhodoplanes sp.]|uniref:C45 family autoproteolytic acyltransferase/hydolase n=1 Tax=Rhodoplanes sp. TaxID=1968906 RepID=UPI0017D2E08A|nr:C45 family peptidase [Rhodoplanes sp.]NVO13427.1 hypothetical protein [Rhodoplanes sp.]